MSELNQPNELEWEPEVAPAPEQKGWLLRSLRWLGVIGLLVSGYLYTVREISSDPFFSYLGFFGFSVAITIGGWICARIWKDSAGGRSLLGLGAAIIPAHMAQFAGFIYMAGVKNPEAIWLVPTPHLLTLLGVGLPILALTAWLGYSAWLRQVGTPLAATYFFSNLLLLLPMRDGVWVSAIAIGMAIPSLLVSGYLRKNNQLLTSTEGLFARLTLVPPIALVIGRAIKMGEGDFFIIGTVILLSSWFLFLPIARSNQGGIKMFFQLTGLILLPLAWLVYMAGISEVFDPSLPDWVAIGSAIWVPSLLALLLLCFEPKKETKSLRMVVGFAFSIGTALITLATAEAALSIIAIFISTALFAMATHAKEKWLLWLGSIVSLSVLARVSIKGFEAITDINWIHVGLAGLILVLAVSFFENKRPEFKRFAGKMNRKLENWEA